MKRKNEEMKAKIYSLRTQNMELDRRLLETRSTIDSLKDEQRTMEVALEEKQNEIKMLRLKEINVGGTNDQIDQNSQVTALIESLKQKDAEIEDLKNRLLQYPVKVWSVSSDDPSNASVNPTVTAENDEKTRTGTEERDGNGTATKEGDTRRAGETENRVDDNSVRREMMDREIQKSEGSQDRTIKDGDNKRNANETISDDGGDKIDLGRVNGEGIETKGNEKVKKVDNPKGEDQELLGNSKVDNIWFTMRGKPGFVSNTKEKRWRLIAKNRRLENRNLKNSAGPTSIRSRKFFEGDRGGSKDRGKVASFNAGLVSEDHSVEATKVVDSSGTEGQDTIDNIRQNTSSGNINMDSKDKNEVAEYLDVADDVKEPGNQASNGDFFGKSGSTSKEDEEEFKEEIDETEF